MWTARKLHPRQAHDTEIAAAEAIAPHITKVQAKVLDWAVWHSPFTDEKLEQMLGSNSTYRSRRAELVAKGFIADTGQRERKASGRLAIVWTITKEGKEAAHG